MIEHDDALQNFILAFERARYGPDPVPEADFRQLMNRFADLLRSMIPMDPLLLAEFLHQVADEATSDSESDMVDDHSSTPSQTGSVRHKQSTKQQEPIRKREPEVLSNKQSTLPHEHESDADDESLPKAPPKKTARSRSRPSLSSRMFSARSVQSTSQSQSRSRSRRFHSSNRYANGEEDEARADTHRSPMSRTSSRSRASGESRLTNPESGHDLPYEYVNTRPRED